MAESSPAIVRIRSLTKRYGVHVAVEGLDLEIATGEIVGLLGPNGAGKTTTLECLLGLRQPDSGTLEIDGNAGDWTASRIRRFVGAQIQPAALQDKITPREALAFFGSFHSEAGCPDDLLGRFGLAERAHSRFDTLSLGERQRLSVALAFVGRPRLLVLDEPTTGMDPLGRRDLHRILADFRSEGGSVILSTHDLAEAETLCDRVAIIHRGRVVADAPPAALVARARAATSIRFRCARAIGALPDELERVRTATPDASDTTAAVLQCHEPARTIAELSRHLAQAGNELVELTLRPPSLEDAFIALTGEQWEEHA